MRKKNEDSLHKKPQKHLLTDLPILNIKSSQLTIFLDQGFLLN